MPRSTTANLTSSTPRAQQIAELNRREQRDADAVAYIRRTQGDTADLLLSMLGLDGEQLPSGICRRCGNQLPQDQRTSCRRTACVAAAAEEATVLAAGQNLPIHKALT